MLLDLVSIDACNAIRGVPEGTAPERPEHDMLHPAGYERGELGRNPSPGLWLAERLASAKVLG